MASTTQWKLRRLAPRAIRVQARRAGDSPVVAAYGPTLKPKAEAFITVYDAAARYTQTYAKEMEEGRGAIASLYNTMRGWMPLLVRDLPGFDASAFEADPAVPDDVLASAERLFVPQGRIPPLLFDRTTGDGLGSLDGKGGGGCFILLTDDDHVMHGPGNKTGWISDSNALSSEGPGRERLAAFPGGNAMVVDGPIAYVLTDTQLAAMDRTTRKAKWSRPCESPYELILAGDVLFVGGRDKVEAFRADDGELHGSVDAGVGRQRQVPGLDRVVVHVTPRHDRPQHEPADRASFDHRSAGRESARESEGRRAGSLLARRYGRCSAYYSHTFPAETSGGTHSRSSQPRTRTPAHRQDLGADNQVRRRCAR